MWRRGFYDYEYLWLAKQNGKEKEANSIVNAIVKSALAENYKEITSPFHCAMKNLDGQRTKFMNGKCVGTCADVSKRKCVYNDGIIIGPWDTHEGSRMKAANIHNPGRTREPRNSQAGPRTRMIGCQRDINWVR